MARAETVITRADELAIAACFDAYPEGIQPPGCRAFMFSFDNALLGSELLDGVRPTRLRWCSRGREPLRLLLAPATVPSGMIGDEALLELLRELGAVEHLLPATAIGGTVSLPVDWLHWRSWLTHTDRLSGCVLAAEGEQPVSGARVELFALSPLQQVAQEMPDSVLARLRQLLLEGLTPLDIYTPSPHVADAPQLSFAHIAALPQVPGFELLAFAAKGQGDASFRQLLCNNPAILYPLLRYYHPCSFDRSMLGAVTTDSAGRFRFPVLRHGECSSTPGYYFVVRRAITSTLFVSLYEPTPASWYAHWPLHGGETVTLRSAHPYLLADSVPA